MLLTPVLLARTLSRVGASVVVTRSAHSAPRTTPNIPEQNFFDANSVVGLDADSRQL